MGVEDPLYAREMSAPRNVGGELTPLYFRLDGCFHELRRCGKGYETLSERGSYNDCHWGCEGDDDSTNLET